MVYSLVTTSPTGNTINYSQTVLMIYGEPGFLAVLWFGSSPTTSAPLPSVSSTGNIQEDSKQETTCWQEGRRRRSQSYDRKKAWSCINRWILCDYNQSITITISQLSTVKGFIPHLAPTKLHIIIFWRSSNGMTEQIILMKITQKYSREMFLICLFNLFRKFRLYLKFHIIGR